MTFSPVCSRVAVPLAANPPADFRVALAFVAAALDEDDVAVG
ncbi:MAG: hypothetical protein U0360_11445 [Dehalococcoidia bacterium]